MSLETDPSMLLSRLAKTLNPSQFRLLKKYLDAKATRELETLRQASSLVSLLYGLLDESLQTPSKRTISKTRRAGVIRNRK